MKKIWMGLLVFALLFPGWLKAEEEREQNKVATTTATPTFTFGGMVDTYYSLNFTNMDHRMSGFGNNSSLYFYNGKDDTYSLGLAEFKAIASQGPGSFHFTLAYGINASPVAGGAGLNPGDPSGIDVLEAYLSYHWEEWTFNAGRFVNWMGFEKIESKDNWNYTHSLLFQYIKPYWNTGLGVEYMEDPSFKASGYVIGGWNSASGAGIGKTYGLQIVWTPGPAWRFTLNGIAGPGSATAYPNLNGVNDANFVGEAIIQFNTTDKLSFAVDAAYVGQIIPGAKTDALFNSGKDAWFPAFYGRYQFDPDWAVALRYEEMDEDQDLLGLYGGIGPLGTATDVEDSEVTLTLDHSLNPNLLVRLEPRLDMASSGGNAYSSMTTPQGPFAGGSGTQFTTTVGAVLSL